MKQLHEKQKGFTIVELLIVIVVIGILAAIVVVAYSGIQNRANDSAIQADASSIQKSMALAKVDLGHYPSSYAEMTDYTDVRVAKSAYDTSYHNLHYCYNAATDEYALNLRSKSDISFVVTKGDIRETSGIAGGGANAMCIEIGTTSADRDAGWTGFSSGSDVWNQSWSWTAH